VRAWRIERHGGPEALQWVELERPRPGPDEVLIRVRACALNHLDLWVRNGVEGHEFPLPLIPGSEVAGDIESCGETVAGLDVGSPVVLAPGVSCGRCDHCIGGNDHRCRHYGILGEHRDGGYAEWLSVPSRNVLPLPRGLDYVQAAALPLVFLTAWHMLVARAKFEALEDILVHAAGSGVSSAGIQIARLLGGRHIIATASSDAKLLKARELGATHTVNYQCQDFLPRVREITEGKGVDVVLDHIGGETFEKSVAALAWSGRMVICGATSTAAATVHLRPLFFKSLSILGSTMGSQAELRRVLRFVEAGLLRPVVDRTYPLSEARAAQSALEARQQFGKIVLTADAPAAPARERR